MNLKKIIAIALTAAMALSITACGNNTKTESDSTASTTASSTIENGSDVLFTIGDMTLTKAEYMFYLTSYTSGGYKFDMAKDEAKKDATNNLALLALVKAKGITYSDDIKKSIEEQKKNVITQQGGDEKYKEFLKSLGVEDEFIDKLIEGQYAQNALFGDDISEEAEKKYYNDNYYHAKHVLISTMDTATQTKYDDAKIAEQKKLADQILERAKNGEDFDALVAEYSEDPGSKSQPEGYFFTSGEMVQEFESTVAGLGMNEIGMCESDYGYHIIKRLPLDENQDTYNQKFKEVEPTIKSTLISEMTDEKIPQMLKDNNLTIETNEKLYDSITE